MVDRKKPAGGSGASSVSRRTFLKTMGGGAVVTAALPSAGLAAAASARRGDEAEVLGPGKVKFSLQVNGKKREVEAEPRASLLELLRDHLDLTGAKKICDMGECGGCTVLLDDVPHYACLLLAVEARGRRITTVEGLEAEELGPVQKAFVEKDAFQCGFCTPGWVMSVEGLRRGNARPDEAAIQRALSGNLCRCSAYPKILEAARAAVGKEGGRGKEDH